MSSPFSSSIPVAALVDVGPDTGTDVVADAARTHAAHSPTDAAAHYALTDVSHDGARSSSDLMVRWRGVVDYAATYDAMRAFTEARHADPGTPDEIWLVEHPAVYTLGQAGNPAHLLRDAGNVPMVRTDRGGQITYHGPGQVIAYLLIDLRRRRLMVKEFVQRIEQAVIDTLAAYNLAGERHAGAPGIYLATGPLTGAKIAALGLKIRHGCSYHGVSLNVQMNLSPFDDINPCGYAGLKTVDMGLAGVNADWRDVAARLASCLVANLPETSGPRTQPDRNL